MSEVPSADDFGKAAVRADRAPRILLFHPVLWSHYKGVVFSALQEACAAANLSLHVVQIAITEWGRANLGKVDPGVHAYPHELLFEEPYERVSLFRRLIRILSVVLSEPWDVLVIPGYYEPAMWVAVVVGKARGAKIVIESDSTHHDRDRWELLEWLKSLLVRMCDLAFCYGTRARTYIVKLGMPVERTMLRCQATDGDTISRIHGEFALKRKDLVRGLGICERNFVFVGRLSAEKNVRRLIEAFTKVARELAEWGLVIVGDGPERGTLEHLVTDELRSRVFFAGGKGWKEVPLYYAVADVLVLPSLSEPWGLVVNEALACGLPVLVSDRCGCVPELVIEGDSGFTFDPENVDQLARIMLEIATDGNARTRLSRYGPTVAAQYTPARSAREMCRGLRRVLSTGDSRC